jgi:hypothetical protein
MAGLAGEVDDANANVVDDGWGLGLCRWIRVLRWRSNGRGG